jgi:uncharacterized surface protein with fasciclin (FAS1) repeats
MRAPGIVLRMNMRHLTAVALTTLLAASAGLAGGPETTPTARLLDVAREAGTFKTLLAAVDAAGLRGALEADGPFTVFAPTDDAFAALPEGALEDLLKPENREKLRAVLTLHVVAARATAVEALKAGQVKTLSGETLTIAVRDGRVCIDGAAALKTDITAANGVIHVIDRVLLPAPAVPAKEAAILVLAIERGAPLYNQGQQAACAAIYEVAARAVVELGTLSSGDRARLEEASVGRGTASDRAWRLRGAFDTILARMQPAESTEETMKTDRFEPLMEAPLPQGFPAPGPVGEAVVKEYPRYRAARTSGGMSAFWTLFGHIKRNNIEMTAPVEMTMEEGERVDMAFLYESPEQGQAGKEGAVDVLDLPAVRVVSIGIRGNPTPAQIEGAKREIERLRAEKGMDAAGPFRLLGYNSPMVPAKNRFYELQLPVRAKQS